MQDAKLKIFLRDFMLSDSQLHTLLNLFSADISKGLKRETNAQADTKCYVTYVQDLPTGNELGKYLALDLGGTNFRVLLVTLKGQHEADVISKIYAVPIHLIKGAGEKLFDHIAACLASFVEEQKVAGEHLSLGFTFSFPCIQLGLTKALLVRWMKGYECTGVENADVGQLLKEAIARRADNALIDVVAVLNDTTGTLMSCGYQNADCRIGVIIGTGSNACYVESVEHVDLLEHEFKRDKKLVIINTECGAFGDSGQLEFIRTVYDRELDKLTSNTGSQLYEKMIAGLYLGELVRVVLHKATLENLIFTLSSKKSKIAEILDSQVGCFETRFISDIEADNFPDFQNTRNILKELFDLEKASVEDCQKLQYICECLSRRAASLVAVIITGLINRIKLPKVIVGLDGSVYRLHPKFDAYIRETLVKLVDPKLQYDLMLSEDGSGRGAALVAAVASRNI